MNEIRVFVLFKRKFLRQVDTSDNPILIRRGNVKGTDDDSLISVVEKDIRSYVFFF